MNNLEGKTQEPVGGMEDILDMHINNVAGLKDLTKWHKGFIYQAMNKYASEKVFEYQKSGIDDVAEVIKEYNKQIKEYEKYCQSLEYLFRDIDITLDFGDLSDAQKIKTISEIVTAFNNQLKIKS